MASTSDQYQHPLPPAPHQQQYQAQTQARQPENFQYSQPSLEQQHRDQAQPRTFSYQTHKSRNSSGSKNSFHETHEEKESRRLHTKADPTLAMNEAEPSALAAMRSDNTTTSLRSIQHKDTWGNPIADPDKSNPTRNRWERPLDTIRSFEAAIDGGYNRKSMYKNESDSIANWNRRSTANTLSQPRFPQESYYGSRPTSFRDSQFGMRTPGTRTPMRNSYYDNLNGSGGYGGAYDGAPGRAPRERNQRMTSESHYQVYGREQGYQTSYQDRSYETVTSAAPSGHSDQAGYQTDPTSSDNSSIERTQLPKRQEPVNDYGIGFSNSQAYDASNFSAGIGVSNQSVPPPPPKHGGDYAQGYAVPRRQASVLRRQPTRQQQQIEQHLEAENSQKRKSWFSRRFSKNG